MKEKKKNKKNKSKKKVVFDERLETLARQERENYSSRSWNIQTSGGFYN